MLVGVAGGSGAGKTAIVRAFAGRVGEARSVVLQHDWYYRDLSSVPRAERARRNYDHPEALETPLLVAHLEELRRGCAVEAPRYDFTTHAREPETRRVEPRELVLVAGILVLDDAALRDVLDLRVWVEAPDDVRFLRRLARDMEERGRGQESVIVQYAESVRPMYVEFVEPSRRFADLVLQGQGELSAAVRKLEGAVEACAAAA